MELKRLEKRPPLQEQMDRFIRNSRRKWTALTIWVIIFTLFTIYLFMRLQDSRVESCRDTYGSFNKVFDPFLDENATGEQKDRQDHFHQIVRDLKAGCDKQVTQ